MSIPDPRQMERRLVRIEQQLRALREIGLALESTMSFDEVLTMAVERITSLMGAERSTLFLIEDDGVLVSRVIEGDDVNEIRLGPGQGIAGWVASHNLPLFVHEVYADERFDPEWDQQTGFTTHNVMCHPIVGRHGSVIGVAQVLNKLEGQFDDEDLSLLGLLAGQLAMTVENSKLMLDLVRKNRAITESKVDLERRNRELALLLDLERMVARAEDLDELYTAVLGRVTEITNAQVGVLHRVDEAGADSRVLVQGEQLTRVIRVEAGAGFTGWVAVKGRELCIAEPQGDPRFRESLQQRVGIELKNLAAVPLPFEDGVTERGSLLVANKDRDAGFDDSDLAVLRLVAAQVAQALQHVTGREFRERERRLATLGRLLAGVLHDLKSPITVISGYTELLAAKAGDGEAEEYLGHVDRALDRISTMAEEIIAFSKGERRILLAPVSLAKFMDKFVEQISRYLELNEIELSVQARTSGTIKIDEDKLIRAFQNIVLNAVEAMPNGGRLTVEVDRVDGTLVFGFTDIRKQLIAHGAVFMVVFEDFARGIKGPINPASNLGLNGIPQNKNSRA